MPSDQVGHIHFYYGIRQGVASVMVTHALQGIRVLDFSRVLAGPYCTRILADFGAQVIKVQTRKGSTGAEDNASTFFNNWNRNKLGITLNMSLPEARDLALALVVVSDVVVENFSPRVMTNWSMTYKHLRRIKSDIIVAGMSGFGRTGPWKDYVAFAPTIHSLSGHTSINSGDKEDPGGLGHAHADMISGLYCTLAILAALENRKRTGQGQHIDLSEYEATCTTLGPELAAIWTDEHSASRNRGLYPYVQAAPYGCYPCRGEDRWCAIAVLDEDQWRALSRIMGNPVWTNEYRFASESQRKCHEEELDRFLSRWTAEQSAEELAAGLQEAGIPAGVVQTASDLARDPHLLARNMFKSMAHPHMGMITVDRSPISFGDGIQESWQPSPKLGEHNVYVFKELLGLSREQYDDYVDRGVIG